MIGKKMTKNPELWTYAEAYNIHRNIALSLEPGPCGEFAEACAWITVKTGSFFVSEQLFDDLYKEFESLKAEGIFNIPYG
jgi:hypothetical protein